ncbi:MAG: ABC transporter ATP-binding protein [Deltaproteobacteria bacterium]|nr:ABC transporter ATP-binding protein [Deltaproteobacteria bacterium]
MRRLHAYMHRYRWRYVFGLACLLVTASLAMLIPFLLKRAVEVIEHDRALSGLSFYVALIIGMAIVQGVARTFSRFVIFNIGRDIEYDLRNDLFRHLETLPQSFYQRSQTGDLMSRLVNDIGAVRMMIGPGILNFINTPIYYVYAVSIMVTISVPLTLLSLTAYPVVLWIVKRMSRQLMERTVKVQEGLAALSARAQENLAAMTVVKAYALEGAEIAHFERMNGEFQEQSLALARVRGFIVPVMKLVSSAGILVVLWFGGWQVIRGRIGIGDLVAFIAYLHLLAWPTMALGWMLSILQRGRASMKRLEHIFAADPGVAGPPADGEAPVERGELELENVRFAYPGIRKSAQVLDGVRLRVPAGATLAIVGRTGAGKTTLVQLIPRLFDPQSGIVRIDGRDVRSLSLATLRRSLGVVPQDPFLFSTTLRDNIAYGITGNGDADDRVRWAASVAGLGADLDVLPRGLETPVGERGITLSGGQKQRVTLARALAIDPKILIFDDALSSVDSETERCILRQLRESFPGRTRIVISHRLSTVRGADTIVVLDGGAIVESGTHEDLMRRGGVYAEMFEEQIVESELETL